MNLLISAAIVDRILLKLDRFVHSLAPAIGSKMPQAGSVDRLEYRIIIPTKTQKRSDFSIKADRYQKSSLNSQHLTDTAPQYGWMSDICTVWALLDRRTTPSPPKK